MFYEWHTHALLWMNHLLLKGGGSRNVGVQGFILDNCIFNAEKYVSQTIPIS